MISTTRDPAARVHDPIRLLPQAVARCRGLPVHVPRENDARAVLRARPIVLAGARTSIRACTTQPTRADHDGSARDRFEIELAWPRSSRSPLWASAAGA